MAETNNPDEPSLPTKRKFPEEQNPSLKSPKLIQNGTTEPKHDVSDDDNDDDDDYNLQEEEKPKVVDKKGKGILIEKEENSSDDDGDDVSSDEDGDDVSDESDDAEGEEGASSEEEDPLAEVDLENILPSRTRRKVSQRGVCIKDVGVNGSGNDG